MRSILAGLALGIGAIVVAANVDAADTRAALTLLAVLAIPTACVLAAIDACGAWLR